MDKIFFSKNIQSVNKIYDFSCGCGNLAHGAVQKNKNFVCSDINKKCIFYIAKNIMNM